MSARAETDIRSPVAVLIAAAAMAATACAVLVAPAAIDALDTNGPDLALFLALTLALQLAAVRVYGTGRESVAAVGILATGITLGSEAAVAAAVVVSLVHWARARGLVHRHIFDVANFVLSAAVGSFVFHSLSGETLSSTTAVIAAAVAGIAYKLTNTGLLCAAMSLSESQSVRQIWNERFRWALYHYLSTGPLALASALAYEQVGLVGLLAFAVPPALLMLSIRQYLDRTRAAVEELREANAKLNRANEQLNGRNEDLRELFDFTRGLAPRVHDRVELIGYAEEWLSRMTGGDARIRIGRGSGGIPLAVAGDQVGTLSLLGGNGFEADRWERLRDAIVPQLATAIESTALVEKVRKMHLATIAALSRSIEAKDHITGSDSERIAALVVALARRLGYSGTELEAIKIGAVLQDIGKIGIPESILEKPGPLTAEEWTVVKKHPVIADYILSEVELPPIVRQIARSSRERIDGTGYPDGLAGTQIPLPARIAFVAQAWVAVTGDRPYRTARAAEAALEELRSNTGTQFCPTVVAALEQLYRDEPQVLAPSHLSEVA